MERENAQTTAPIAQHSTASAGGSVQYGLSAAGGALGFYQLGHAADNRYSLAITTSCHRHQARPTV